MSSSSSTTVGGMTTATQADATLLADMPPGDSSLLERARRFQFQFRPTTPPSQSRKHELEHEVDADILLKHRRLLPPVNIDDLNVDDDLGDLRASKEVAANGEQQDGTEDHATSRADKDIGTRSGLRDPNSISTSNPTATSVQSAIPVLDYIRSTTSTPSSTRKASQSIHQLIESPPAAQLVQTIQHTERHNKPNDVWGMFNEVVEELASLQEQNRILREMVGAMQQRLFPAKIQPSSQVVHQVSCDCRKPHTVSLFTDQPQFNAFSGSDHIEGRSRVSERTTSELSRSGVILLIRKKYICSVSARRRQRLRKHGLQNPGEDEDTLAPACGESVNVTTESVCGSLRSVFSRANTVPFDITPDSQIEAPYVFYYHNRSTIKQFASALDDESRRFMDVIIAYFESFSPEFSQADTLFADGYVHYKVLSYLFKPDQVIVEERNNQLSAYSIVAYPKTFGVGNRSCQVNVWRYDYDGRFFVVHDTFNILCPDTPKPVPITELPYYPLKYAAKGVETRLREPGKQFWKCRDRRYVQYRDPDSTEMQLSELRFMIDYTTMPANERILKSKPSSTETETGKRVDYLDTSSITTFDIEQGVTPLLFPGLVKGFNMREKRWEVMKTSGIADVVWNKQAFESLVAEPETKEFVQALVMNQLEASKSTDLISGKGSSLVILLHGGPGTGKTLTAESVAEIAERPLYRVTCGDIGTNPADVEVRLQRVLRLGKHWGCVVLLDEADLFLEQRSLEDLGRNALVSVFLRALEYYEGILILTTNRIGTFDAAFKSRIQLSLKYDSLTEEQRVLIWENFFKRLEKIDAEGIDLCNLRQHTRKLARHNMNGREIRNSLTNARQLAKYKSEIMDINHLQRAVRVFNKFEEYTKAINQGISDETIAREKGER